MKAATPIATKTDTAQNRFFIARTFRFPEQTLVLD